MAAAQQQRLKELVQKLNEANKAYYQEDREIISNREYDRLYDELQKLEEETGTVLSQSPTLQVGYEAIEELPKETHESPMLSLDKTKDVEVLRDFIGDQQVLLSWKLDGLTIVLTYENGALEKAVTRGNGTVGEVITNNAKVFCNIPLRIPYTGRLVLRGEAVITYPDFERINKKIAEADARYKNPRNLCSGSVRQLNNEITAGRNVRFYAFSLVIAGQVDFYNSRRKQMEWLKGQGFDVVEYQMVNKENLDEAIKYFSNAVNGHILPSDGLVALYDDIAYGDALGNTAKFPRNSFAFKWADEVRETILRQVEWSPSRTGLINPIAIFDPVELEGTTVSRASVHNVSILKELGLAVGDRITVYKANMIIPQIAENLTPGQDFVIPTECPACGKETAIHREKDVETLYCPNPQCPAKRIKSFTLFVSRNALNIDGLSEATLEKLIGAGFLHDFGDIFELSVHREAIVEMEGLGEKSCEKLLAGIEKARRTTLPKVLYSLGIPGIGLANAKLICSYFQGDLEKIKSASAEELSQIDGVGPVLAGNIEEYFSDEENIKRLSHLLSHLLLENEERMQEQKFAGLHFVITGSLLHFANRGELREVIEAKGGKVTSSVTANTSYLINNDTASNSSKNKKARELGIPVLSEEDFLAMARD